SDLAAVAEWLARDLSWGQIYSALKQHNMQFDPDDLEAVAVALAPGLTWQQIYTAFSQHGIAFQPSDFEAMAPLLARDLAWREVVATLDQHGSQPASPDDLAPIAAWINRNLLNNEAYPVFHQNGFHLLRRHFYLPIPEEDDLAYIPHQSGLVGLDINEEATFGLLNDVLNPYKAEFNAYPIHHQDDFAPDQFYLINSAFMAIDGNVYYSLVRHYKPKRVVEIGSGFSTLLAADALRKNAQENSEQDGSLICIEPYPSALLTALGPRLHQLIDDKVQEVDLEFFASLGAGDILFIDSSHVLRSGGDVWYEYCEILPRLASGVLVHIHDISLPKPYPREYFDRRVYWNEQYLLQAFLTFNPRFEIIWPGNYLMTKYPERIRAAFLPEYDLMREVYPSSEPSSFWMRVR
ncbi:MAG: class I SAM-dependent methyltransferase, partial [Chloroflexi bacterium]|nr:class I SAM-dependent methyltransferase [Chloroflexota bacterium]